MPGSPWWNMAAMLHLPQQPLTKLLPACTFQSIGIRVFLNLNHCNVSRDVNITDKKDELTDSKYPDKNGDYEDLFHLYLLEQQWQRE